MANVCCSIEMEPKTLNEGQLNYAREVAADVVQKMEPKEASTAFIKGLELVVPVTEMEQMEDNGGDQHEHKEAAECKKTEIIENPYQCSYATNSVESPDQMTLKEPLSAPF